MSHETEKPKSIAELVKERVNNSTEKVKERVVEALTERELKSRESLIISALDKLSEMDRDLRKLKPDTKVVGPDGETLQEGFTPAKYEELKKAKEQKEKLEAALEKAFAGDFQKLKEILK